MSIEANKAVIRRYKEGILNSRDLVALDAIVTEDCLDHAAFRNAPSNALGPPAKGQPGTRHRAADKRCCHARSTLSSSERYGR